jgi:hypothetical protein
MASAARVRETPPTEIAIFGRMPASAQYSVQLSGQAALEIALPPSRYYKGVCRKLPGPRCAGNSDMRRLGLLDQERSVWSKLAGLPLSDAGTGLLLCRVGARSQSLWPQLRRLVAGST